MPTEYIMNPQCGLDMLGGFVVFAVGCGVYRAAKWIGGAIRGDAGGATAETHATADGWRFGWVFGAFGDGLAYRPLVWIRWN